MSSPAVLVRRRAINRGFIAFLVVLGVMFVLTFLPLGLFGKRPPINGPGEHYPDQGHRHLSANEDAPVYNTEPPSSGPHTPARAPWGVYTTPPPDPQLVHNLEDGGVILWYALGTPEEETARVAALQEAATGFRRVVIAPRAGLEALVTLSAWTTLERLDTLDAPRIRAFVEAYEGVDHHTR